MLLRYLKETIMFSLALYTGVDMLMSHLIYHGSIFHNSESEKVFIPLKPKGHNNLRKKKKHSKIRLSGLIIKKPTEWHIKRFCALLFSFK